MDVTVAEYIRRTILKIPHSEIATILTTWGFLSEDQLQPINFHQTKENVSREVVEICQENCATIKQAADLDIIYSYRYRDKKRWIACWMTRTEGDESDYFDLTDFKKKFKASLRSALKNVTVSFKQYEDNAIWIRIAWGTQYTKPNQYKPSYVVYHSQTPYIFISHSIYRKCRPLLYQALFVAANCTDLQEMNLQGRCLDSLKDILFKRYSQGFQSYSQPLQEKNSTLERVDPRIIQEDKSKRERIQRLNREAFGDGPQPKLEFAQYKLETTLRSERETGILNDNEPFRCMVRFSSSHLLEALKSLAPSGVANAPLSPLLTCISQKARNSFTIKDRKDASSQKLSNH